MEASVERGGRKKMPYMLALYKLHLLSLSCPLSI